MIFILYYLFFFTASEEELKSSLRAATAQLEKSKQGEKLLHVKDCLDVLFHQLSEHVLGRKLDENIEYIPTRWWHLAEVSKGEEQEGRLTDLVKHVRNLGFKDTSEMDKVIQIQKRFCPPGILQN